MLTGKLKAITIDLVQTVILELQERRKFITDETVKEFGKIRKLCFDY